MSLSLFMKEQTGDPQILYDAVDLRQLIDAAYPVAGVINDTDYKVTQRAAGANTSVDVAAGTAVLQGISVSNQGKYQHEDTSGQNFTMPSKPAVGQSRIDVVCLRQFDHPNDGNSNTTNPGPYDCPVVVVQGTATTGTPAVPTIPPAGQVWSAFLPLAQVLRTGAEVSIATAAITDIRPRARTVPNSQIETYPATIYAPLIKTGSAALTVSGAGTVTFDYTDHGGTDFPHNAYAPVVCNGDGTAFPGGRFTVGTYNTSGFSAYVLTSAGVAVTAGTVRISFVAPGD